MDKYEKINELQLRKFPKEYAAKVKALSDWWKSLAERENKDDPDSFRTSVYPAFVEAHETLWNLTYQDEEYKTLKDLKSAWDDVVNKQ
jgi:hypothetical protein